MTITKYTRDQSVTAEAAAIMRESYNTVLSAFAAQNIRGVSSEVIARNIASAVFDGETDSAQIVKSILSGLVSKE